MEMNYLIFYDKIEPVLGYTKSIICDMQYGSIYPIPNSMYYIIQEFQNKSIEEVKSQYDEEENIIVDEYLKVLIDSNFCYIGDSFDKKLLTKATDQIELSSLVSNCVVDFNEDSKHDMNEIVTQLNELGCIGVELRFFFSPALDVVVDHLQHFKDSGIENIEVLLMDSKEFDVNQFKELLKEFPRVDKFILHSSEKEEDIKIDHSYKMIIKTTAKITSEKCCGTITYNDFSINTLNYSDNKYYNSCLHKKISVDSNGLIGNCPAMSIKFGKVGTVKFADVLQKKEYIRTSTIPKDAVSKCKDCEFRYVCSDCRAFTEHKDLYGKPLKCKYDPYTGIWT